MVRGGVCTAALAVVVVCVALISNAEAGRTHELFAQSTYDDSTTLPMTVSGATAAVVPEPLKNNHNEKTSTTPTVAQSTLSEPQEAQVSTDPGAIHDPESARAQETATFVKVPQEQQLQQNYREYRGTTPVQGDFRPDARPWWFNPGSGNYVQGRYPQLDTPLPSIPPIPSIPTIPTIPAIPPIPAIPTTPSDPNMATRYPMGYPTESYMGPRFYESQNFHPSNAAQYSAMSQQQQHQYSQTGFPQYTGNVPYEMTGGGCPTQYWISNTQRWPAFFTVKTTVGDALGTPASKVFGHTTLLQALLNTRPDGYSTLLRSASTAILNSYNRSQYKFSHVDVIESFAKALSSSKAAAQQAAAFEEANVSAYTEQYNYCF